MGGKKLKEQLGEQVEQCWGFVQHKEQSRFEFSVDMINLIQCKGRAKVELLQKESIPCSEILYQEISAHEKKNI